MAPTTTTQNGAGKGINKMEAVRRALARFGNDAKPAQMQPWIESEFGIKMSTDHISTYKGDILRKAAAKGKSDGARAAAPKPAGPQQGAGRANGLTKMEAVRRALQELGNDARPAQLQPLIKQRFGLDMTPEHITTRQGKLLAGAGRKGKKKQAAPVPAAPAKATAGRQRAGNGNAAGGVSLKDLAVVKDLVGRVGADSLRSLIDLLAR
jgi:hypothetical protein